MGKIVVKLAGKELFEWSGGKAEIADLEKRVRRAARSVRKTVGELTALTLETAFSLKGLMTDPDSRDMQIGGMVHYLLHLPTSRPNRPGTHREYVIAGWDFVFDLFPEQPGRGRIEVSGREDW